MTTLLGLSILGLGVLGLDVLGLDVLGVDVLKLDALGLSLSLSLLETKQWQSNNNKTAIVNGLVRGEESNQESREEICH